ncbi:MAG: AbrB/MazE/SpoVT family DNA-binding domain-containing protein [Candidatus Saccharimonadales bacterium]
MKSVYTSKIAKGGNSYVIRLPKAARQVAQLGDDVILTVTSGKIVVVPKPDLRAEWAAQTNAAFHDVSFTDVENVDQALFDQTVGDGLDETEDAFWKDKFKNCI